MISKHVLLWAITLLIPLHVRLYEHFAMTFSHSQCQIFAHDIVSNMSCTSRIINRTRYGSVDVNFQPSVKLYNVYVMSTFYYKFGTVYRPHIIKMEQELCQFLKDNSTSKIFLTVSGMWRKAGNFLDPCPVEGRRYLKDVQYELENLPVQIVPAGEWRLDSAISTKINNTKVQLILMSEYFEVKTKTALQWKK